MLRRVGHVAHMGLMRRAYKILVRQPERKRLFGIWWEGVDWVYLDMDDQ